jgi:hypothetical protein
MFLWALSSVQDRVDSVTSMATLVQMVFPKHRFGDAEIILGEMFEKVTAEDESCESEVTYYFTP